MNPRTSNDETHVQTNVGEVGAREGIELNDHKGLN
jgi:hypothetical protein